MLTLEQQGLELHGSIHTWIFLIENTTILHSPIPGWLNPHMQKSRVRGQTLSHTWIFDCTVGQHH